MTEFVMREQPSPALVTEMTGAEIKKAAGIDLNRQLLLVGKDGPRLVRNEERVEAGSDDRFEAVPNWRYGHRSKRPSGRGFTSRRDKTRRAQRRRPMDRPKDVTPSAMERIKQQLEGLSADVDGVAPGSTAGPALPDPPVRADPNP